MTFDFLRDEIRRCSNDMSFKAASDALEELIFGLERRDFLPLVVEIGIIPEDIAHDSSEEKLYAKCADIVLAKSFMELGLNATVNRERANCADVVARSTVHGYSLVGDAKAFRLSRTAKNQKDLSMEDVLRKYGQASNNLFHVKSSTGDSGYHPTQKPLKLMELLIELTTQKGDLVVDPFAGSGTTLVAACLLGRHYVGFEKEQGYVEAAKKRLRDVTSEGDLFTRSPDLNGSYSTPLLQVYA